MVYYTAYEMTARGPDAEQAMDAVIKTSEYGGWDQYGGCWNLKSAKWYDWLKDVKSASLTYPNAVIIIEGEGEESGDVWKAWVCNGKIDEVEAKIEFPEPEWVAEVLKSADAEAAAKLETAERAKLEELKAKYGEDA